jgi:hypothetical protein
MPVSILNARARRIISSQATTTTTTTRPVGQGFSAAF